MGFGPDTIQPPAHINFRDSVCQQAPSARDSIMSDIAAMNKERRIATKEREAEQNE